MFKYGEGVDLVATPCTYIQGIKFEFGNFKT